MGFSSGTADVGEEAAAVCRVPENGVLLKNLGGTAAYFGGPDVTPDAGYPLDPGNSETIPGTAARESPVVPAPADDMAPAMLYARTAQGAGTTRVSFITAARLPRSCQEAW